MAKARWSVGDVLARIAADSDSEQEIESGDDGWPSSDSANGSDFEPEHDVHDVQDPVDEDSDPQPPPNRGGGRGRRGNRGGRGGRGGRGRGRGVQAPGNARERGRGGRGRGRGRGRARARPEAFTLQWEPVDGLEVYVPWIRDFTEPVGPIPEIQGMADKKAIDFLALFLSDEFWNILVVETNRYAHQYLDTHQLPPHSRYGEWTDVTLPIMKAFIALHISMGLVDKACLQDYWQDWWLTETPGYGKVMPRNKFQLILAFLHFSNNEDRVPNGEPGHDRLFKIRRIIDELVPKFSALYSPHKPLSLDEMTIPFKGRSRLRVYNKDKPDKYGYKVYVLSEGGSGYVLKWNMHVGAPLPGDDPDQLGSTHLTVRRLLIPTYINKGHEVYMDSYYTSPRLALEFSELETGICGTVSFKRKAMPVELSKDNLVLHKGDPPVHMRSGKLLAVAWHDVKRLTMLTSLHSNAVVPKRIRSKETEDGFREVQKPMCVDKYNSHMGGVDTSDQRMKTYLFPHRSRKWYMRIINAIISICIVNSYILYMKVKPEQHGHPTLKEYIKLICIELLEGYAKKERKVGKPTNRGVLPQRLTERHWLDEADDRPDCVVCSDRSRPKGRRQTKFRCRVCDIGLCAIPCNERYHTHLDYKQCHLDR
jgi:hypothetical protein